MNTPFDEAIAEIRRLRYHNHRREEHAALIGDGIYRDLTAGCERLRADVSAGEVERWHNEKVPGARERKLDLIIGESGAEPASFDFRKLRICLKNKSVTTAHRNSVNRFDDLSETLKVVHAANPEAILIATVLIGVAPLVLNVPDKIKATFKGNMREFKDRIEPRLSSGDQTLWTEFAWAVSRNRPQDARSTVDKLRLLPVRRPGEIHVAGYDFILCIPVFIDNVNVPYVARDNDLGLDVDAEYAKMVSAVCSAYDARWHSVTTSTSSPGMSQTEANTEAASGRLAAIPAMDGKAPLPESASAPRSLASTGPTLLFSWIHLSDLHFGHGTAAHGWDQILVTRSLIRDLRELLQGSVPAPDVVLVTGDIAFSGDTRQRPGGLPSNEYPDAREFLRTLGKLAQIGPEKIFVIPGNHDVQRSADQERTVGRLVGVLRSGSEPLDDALAHMDDRALLAKRQAHFLQFAADFAPACLSGLAPAEHGLWWWHRLDAQGGLRVRLVGLNTALLSANDKDQGALRLGMAPLIKTLMSPAPDADELVVALSHHPLRGGWLADEKQADAALKRHAHVHLYGHIHEADSEETRAGAGGSFLRIGAGAVHHEEGTAPSHGYNLAAVVRFADGTLRLRIWPRRWSSRNMDFRPDIENIPAGQPFAEHELRLRAP